MERFERLKRRVAPAALHKRSERPIAFAPFGILRAAHARRKTRNELVTLAWPIAAAMVGETMIGLVDTKLVGGISAVALGGVGIATTLMYLQYAIIFGLMRGVKVRTSFAVGGGRAQDGLVYARAGVILGASAGVFIFLIARDVTWALDLLGVDASIKAPAQEFLGAVTFGAPATCALAALIQHRQAIGDSRTPMVIGIAGNVLNAALAITLIYGKAGFPALGVRGAGYATAFTENVELLVMGGLLLKQKGASTLPWRRALHEVAELGVPTGMQFGFEMLAFTAFTAILGSISSQEIAAHQIALATIRTSFLPGVAISEAGCVLVGRALGERRLDEADRVTFAALKLAASFMGVCGLLFAVFASGIAGVFTRDPVVVRIAQRLLYIAAIFQVLDAVNIVLRGALRGAKDVRVVALIGIGATWTCVPTAAYFLGKMAGWGAAGGWCGFIAETTVASFLSWRRWQRGAWRLDYAPLVAVLSDAKGIDGNARGRHNAGVSLGA